MTKGKKTKKYYIDAIRKQEAYLADGQTLWVALLLLLAVARQPSKPSPRPSGPNEALTNNYVLVNLDIIASAPR